MFRLSQLFRSVASSCCWLLLITTAGAQAQSTAGSSDSAAMTERVQQLEKQLAELKSEIAAMKSASSTAPAPAAAAAVPQSNLVAGSAPAESAKSSTLSSILGPTSLSGFVDVYYG